MAEEAITKPDWEQHCEAGRYQDSFAILDALIAGGSTNYWHRFWYAFCAARTDRNDIAISILRDLVKLDVDRGAIHALFEALVIDRQWNQAAEAFEQIEAGDQFTYNEKARMAFQLMRSELDFSDDCFSPFGMAENLLAYARAATRLPPI